MPRKKKSADVFENDVDVRPSIKSKSLFDHIRAITEIQDPNYFDKLSDGDKKSWSTYMINRFLSMNMDWTELIADLDQYTTAIQLSPELVYKMYINIFPKGRVFLKYIKSQTEIKYNKNLIDFLKSHFEISSKECKEYLDIMFKTERGISEIRNLLYYYGTEPKEADKLLKI